MRLNKLLEKKIWHIALYYVIFTVTWSQIGSAAASDIENIDPVKVIKLICWILGSVVGVVAIAVGFLKAIRFWNRKTCSTLLDKIKKEHILLSEQDVQVEISSGIIWDKIFDWLFTKFKTTTFDLYLTDKAFYVLPKDVTVDIFPFIFIGKPDYRYGSWLGDSGIKEILEVKVKGEKLRIIAQNKYTASQGIALKLQYSFSVKEPYLWSELIMEQLGFRV